MFGFSLIAKNYARKPSNNKSNTSGEVSIIIKELSFTGTKS